MAFLTKDSGKRRSFGRGAVRDDDADKPRFSEVPTYALNALTNGNFPPIEQNSVTLRPTPQENYDLIPTELLDSLQALLVRGANKYSAHNWRRGIPTSVFYDSAMRHLMQWRMGDTSEHHLAGVLFNIMGILVTEIDIQEGKLPKELADMGVLCGLIQKNLG